MDDGRWQINALMQPSLVGGRMTLRKAHQILGEYLEPGPRDADETITQLIAVLDTQDLVRAIERLEKGHGLRVLK
jgi:hypothetical protein